MADWIVANVSFHSAGNADVTLHKGYLGKEGRVTVHVPDIHSSVGDSGALRKAIEVMQQAIGALSET